MSKVIECIVTNPVDEAWLRLRPGDKVKVIIDDKGIHIEHDGITYAQPEMKALPDFLQKTNKEYYDNTRNS